MMERNITPHAINGFAKILREKRKETFDSYRELDWEQPRMELLDEITLATATWLVKNGIDPEQFIERTGYVPDN